MLTARIQWKCEGKNNITVEIQYCIHRYYDTVFATKYPEGHCICRIEVCTNRKLAPFQVLLIVGLLIFRLSREEVPSTTRKSKELITNVRL